MTREDSSHIQNKEKEKKKEVLYSFYLLSLGSIRSVADANKMKRCNNRSIYM
jgi:hypothetical protein